MSCTTERIRAEFVTSVGFELDRFQLDALDALDEGRSVLVAAPTGSGKTLIAHYALEQALAVGRRTFYTTPLKALSNQKYGELAARHGARRVGLLTGDVSRNATAEILVMTTEVLRNMIYAQPERLSDLGCVVLDEVHYLQDRYRGSVWEEIILSAPKEIILVCLSATVSNAEELASWMAGVRGEVTPVIEEHRPVELRQLYVLQSRRSGELEVLPTFIGGRANPEALELDRLGPRQVPGRGGPRGKRSGDGARRARRSDVLERFDDLSLLPAIYFVFSRAGCDDALRQCMNAGVRFTSSDERKQIRAIADRHVEPLGDADLRLLGYGNFRSALEAGIAAHHAGLVPQFREAVEELFSQSLVKAVFATETLALGINMPARSVVIEALSKFSGHGHEDLTPGEYTQLTGRAGRRGIDEVGYAAVLYSPYHRFEDVALLASSRTGPLTSSFRPTPNMAVNLVRRHTREDAYRLVRSSFAQYQSEVPLTRQLDGLYALLAERGYMQGWRLNAAGERLAAIYHECDLLVAEAIGSGLLDGLAPAELAAILSLLTFEGRRSQARHELPTRRLERRADALEELADDLRFDERRHHVTQTRRLERGFARIAYDWASGHDLVSVLRAEGGRRRNSNDRRSNSELVMSGGDFVRNAKQLIDLVRQVGAAAGAERLEKNASGAEAALHREIVALANAPVDPLTSTLETPTIRQPG